MPLSTQLVRKGEVIHPNILPDGTGGGWDWWTLAMMINRIEEETGKEIKPEENLLPNEYVFTTEFAVSDMTDHALLEIKSGDVFRAWR